MVGQTETDGLTFVKNELRWELQQLITTGELAQHEKFVSVTSTRGSTVPQPGQAADKLDTTRRSHEYGGAFTGLAHLAFRAADCDCVAR